MQFENKALPLAHVKQQANGQWEEHTLEAHLRDVAKLAGEFAAPFNSADWAGLAGVWHDLGKYSNEFQRYIKTVSGYDAEAHIEGVNRVDHSTAGALYAMRQLGTRGRILAYLIAGLRLLNGKNDGFVCDNDREISREYIA